MRSQTADLNGLQLRVILMQAYWTLYEAEGL